MDSSQVIAKVICFFNCHDEESPLAAESTQATEIMPISVGITTSTDRILSPDDGGNRGGNNPGTGEDAFWHHLPLLGGFLRIKTASDREEKERDLFLLILLWFYLVSMILNMFHIYCISAGYFQNPLLMKKLPKKPQSGLFGELSDKINDFFVHLGLYLPRYKSRFATNLRMICYCSITLSVCDFLCVVGDYYEHGIIGFSLLTIIFSLYLPLAVSNLFHAFLFDTLPHKTFLGSFGLFFGLMMTVFIVFFTRQAHWICSIAVAITNVCLFIHLIVILLKPNWFGKKIVPLRDSATQFVTFYAITAMGAISVAIPTRLLWNDRYYMIFFVVETSGRLLFTICHVVFFFYSVLTHHEPEHQLFFRRWSPEEEAGEKEKKKKPIFVTAETKF